jgi:hypothetical protein
MRSSIYWIDAPVTGRLGIMARPRSGDWLEDEIAGWETAEINMVVCLLEDDARSRIARQRWSTTAA